MNIQNVRSIAALPKVKVNSSLVYGSIILVALVAFEFFNYSTTEFALRDLLGDLKFMGLGWATILAVAFCGIDFAGIARLFSSDESAQQQKNTWYLFGAWMLAAAMNAMLTWWGVAVAVSTHAIQGSSVIEQRTLTTVVPMFVAVMVWLIRIMMIGSLTMMGQKAGKPQAARTASGRKNSVYDGDKVPFSHPAPMAASGLAAPMTSSQRPGSTAAMPRPEPTYHSMNAASTRSAGRPVNPRRM